MKFLPILSAFSVATLILSGCVSHIKPSTTQGVMDWQAMALADLDAIHAIVQKAHPGWIDEANPGFRRQAEEGYREAKLLIPKISSYDTATSVVRYYVTGFKDGHFIYSDDLGIRSSIDLNGWMVQKVGEKFIVTAVMPDWKTPLPEVGAELSVCDGRTPLQLIAEKVAPYTDRRDIPEVRADLAFGLSEVWIEGEQLKNCSFQLSSGQLVHLPIGYQKVKVKNFREFQKQGFSSQRVQDAGSRRNTATFQDGTLWIRVQNFMLDDKNAAELKTLLETIAAFRGVNRIIFDARGNGGGDSAVGQRIIDASTGGLVFDQRNMESIPRLYAQWRVSDESIEKLHKEVKKGTLLYGADSLQVHDAKQLEKDLIEAKVAGKNWVTQDGGFSISKLEMQKRDARLRNFDGQIALITDASCASSCLDFADSVLLMPGAIHLGETTSSDTNYIDITDVATPSGNHIQLPVKVWRNRPRGDSQPLVPDIPLHLDIHNDDAVYSETLSALRVTGSK